MGCLQSAPEANVEDNSPKQTDMPQLVDGYVTIPDEIPFEITWELAKKIRIELAWNKWHRSSEIKTEYAKEREQVLAKYDALSSKLLHSIFEVELIENNDGKLTVDVSKPLPQNMKWVRNTFGYNFSKQIIHDLLWCTYQLSKQEIIDSIQQNVPANHEVIWWINPMKFRSVPGLYHVQILHMPT